MAGEKPLHSATRIGDGVLRYRGFILTRKRIRGEKYFNTVTVHWCISGRVKRKTDGAIIQITGARENSRRKCMLLIDALLEASGPPDVVKPRIRVRFTELKPQKHKPKIPERIARRTVTVDGYVYVYTEDGMRPEHRVMMELIVGRALARGENVHHRNTIRHDNRPENLELWYVPQPPGGRVEDMIDYIAEYHPDAMKAALRAKRRLKIVRDNGQIGFDMCGNQSTIDDYLHRLAE